MEKSAAGNWDAWNRLCAALNCVRPLGSSVDDWQAHPDDYRTGNIHSWPCADALRMDSDEHEISREARRIGPAMLAAYKPGTRTGGLAAMARRFRIGLGRAERIIQRADQLRCLGDPAFSG